jgi:hypothetical protein
LSEERRISVDEKRSVSSLWTPAEVAGDSVLIYAPGAGSNLADPFGAFLAAELAPRGISCLRFQFPYSEAKRRNPDPPKVLEATWNAALEDARMLGDRVIASGRSMGGRIASQVVAQGAQVDGLAFFAYPLHPPGRPDQRRDKHFAKITVPMLYCSGTRDAFATPEELETLVATLPRATLHLMEGADHGFAVPKASGRTRQEVWREALAAFLEWVAVL